MQVLSGFFLFVALLALGLLSSALAVGAFSSGSLFIAILSACNAAGLVALGLLFILGAD